eukprot:160713_1
MSTELLNKYKMLYRNYFNELYKKYAPDKINKVDGLMQKYSDSYGQLQALYEKAINKYKVNPNDIKPLITPKEMEQIEFDQNGNIVINIVNNNNNINNQSEQPKTPVKIFENNDNSRKSFVGFPDDANDNNDDNNVQSLDFSGLGSLNLINNNNNNNNSDDLSGLGALNVADNNNNNIMDDSKDNNDKNDNNVSGLGALNVCDNNNNNDNNMKEKVEIKPVAKKKKIFSSEIFDENVPNEEVTYEFFNAFKQIQVEIERLRIERNTFNESISKTKLELSQSSDECSNKLLNLDRELKTEKQICNSLQSELFECKLKTSHQKMYSDAIELKTKCEKLKDKTYTNALKKRGLDEKQENILYKISKNINNTQYKVDELRAYKHDETEYNNNNNNKSNKLSANYIYQRCMQVENIVKDRYNKY